MTTADDLPDDMVERARAAIYEADKHVFVDALKAMQRGTTRRVLAALLDAGIVTLVPEKDTDALEALSEARLDVNDRGNGGFSHEVMRRLNARGWTVARLTHVVRTVPCDHASPFMCGGSVLRGNEWVHVKFASDVPSADPRGEWETWRKAFVGSNTPAEALAILRGTGERPADCLGCAGGSVHHTCGREPDADPQPHDHDVKRCARCFMLWERGGLRHDHDPHGCGGCKRLHHAAFDDGVLSAEHSILKAAARTRAGGAS